MKANRVMRADKKTIFSLAPDFQVDKNTRLGNFTLEGKLIFFNDKEIPHRNQSMIVPTDQKRIEERGYNKTSEKERGKKVRKEREKEETGN